MTPKISEVSKECLRQHSDNPDSPKEPLRGWAPGNYSCTCVDCGMKYTGDKRSFQCYGCAKKTPAQTLTPDTCPHCGAARIPLPASFIRFSCGTRWGGWQPEPTQSPECARYVRTRIAHLRRMADCAHAWIAIIDQADRHGGDRAWCDRNRPRLVRLLAACLREIDRLRGAQ